MVSKGLGATRGCGREVVANLVRSSGTYDFDKIHSLSSWPLCDNDLGLLLSTDNLFVQIPSENALLLH